MSLAETQQIMVDLKEIMALLGNVETKSQTVVADAPKLRGALETFRQLERLALRWLVIARQMGLPDDVSGTIDKLAQLIVIMKMMQTSMSMLMMTNPITFAFGVTGLVMTTMSVPSLLEGY